MRFRRAVATGVIACALGGVIVATIEPRAEGEPLGAGETFRGAPRVVPSSTTTRRTAPPPTSSRTLPPLVPVATHLASPAPVELARGESYSYGPEPHQVLDVFVPGGATVGKPVLVYFHSGGWIAGERANVPDIVARELGRGWAVVSVDYGLAPDHRFPVPVMDADLAVRWVRANGTALGLRTDTIVAVGASAGGHLAAWLAADAGAHRAPDAVLADVPSGVDAAVLLVTPVVMSDLVVHEDTFAPAIVAAYLGCPDGLAERCPPDVLVAADPTRAVKGVPAPVYVIHGARDGMFPAAVHGTAIAGAWNAAGGIAQLEVAPGAGHDLDPSNVDLASIDAFLDAIAAVNAS